MASEDPKISKQGTETCNFNSSPKTWNS